MPAPAELIWLAAAVAVPCALNPWGGSAFELPKALLVRALGLLAVLALLAYVVGRDGPASDLLRSRVALMLLPAAAWALALILATALSVDPRSSLWGSYERQQGLLTRLAYVALFLLVALRLRTRRQAGRLVGALVWGSAPVVAYGLLQALGTDPLGWQTTGASPVLSTLGRSNFLGSYLVLVIPLTLGRLLTLRHRPRRTATIPSAVLLAAQLACLLLTGARAAIIGLGAALAVFGLAWAATKRNVGCSRRRARSPRPRRQLPQPTTNPWALFRRPNVRLAVATLALTAAVVAFVATLTWSTGPLADLPGLGRWAALARTDGGSVAARLTIWRATLGFIGDRPWFGHGPETMRTAFARVFPPQLVYYQGRSAAVDRAHNLWLDTGMTTGLVGLVAFAALLVGSAAVAWRGLTSGSETEDDGARMIWIALAAAVVGHLVDLQASFDLTATATVFWLILGLGAALGLRRASAKDQTAATAGPRPGRLTRYLATAAAATIAIGLLCLPPLLADVAAYCAAQPERPLASRVADGERAVRRWPLEPAYRLQVARLYQEAGDLKRAEAELAEAQRLSPRDARIWAAQGDLYAAWGAVNPARYEQAETAYRRALELAPHTASHHAALGLVLARQERPEDGAAALETAVKLDATEPAAYDQLARLYRVMGSQPEEAWARAQAARWSGE